MGPPGMGMGPPGMMGPSMPPPGMMPPGSGPYPQAYAGASGPYNSMAPGAMQSGGYNAMAPGQVGGPPPPAEGSVEFYVAKYKELSPPKRILVILAPFCLIASSYLLLFDDDDPGPPPVVSSLDGGVEASLAATASGGTAPPPSIPPPVASPPVPVQPSCPPGFVPYSVAINGQIPCVPAGTPMPGSEPNGGTAPPSTAPASTPSAPPVAATTKTLERQAVDYVAVGNYAAGADVYDQLHQQNPNNPVYPEAARILRAKLDAGVP